MDASIPVGFRDDDARAVLAAIDPEETIAFLRELVRAPSVNPPGDVAEAAAVCERPLVAAGFSVQTLAHEPGKPNHRRGMGSRRRPDALLQRPPRRGADWRRAGLVAPAVRG